MAMSLKVAACHWHFEMGLLISLPVLAVTSAKLLLLYLLRTLSIFVHQTCQLGAQVLDLDSWGL